MDPRHNYGVNVYGMKILIWIPRQAKKRVLGTFFYFIINLNCQYFWTWREYTAHIDRQSL